MVINSGTSNYILEKLKTIQIYFEVLLYEDFTILSCELLEKMRKKTEISDILFSGNEKLPLEMLYFLTDACNFKSLNIA